MRQLLFCLLLTSAAVAQDDKRTDVITGQVLDAVSGDPIRKVAVTLRSRQPEAAGQGIGTFTDAEGKFRIYSLQPGKYSLEVRKEGWVRADRAPRLGEVELKDSQPAPPISLKLKRAAIITGRVLDVDGDPISNVSISLMPVRKNPAGSQNQQQGWATTDDRGEYRMRNIAPGRYRVQASGGPSHDSNRSIIQRPEGGGVEESPAPTFYPSALDASDGAILQIESGQELQGIDIQLRSSRAVRIRGRVIGLPSGFQGGVVVSLAPANRPWQSDGGFVPLRTDKGTFELAKVRPGRYVLMARGGMMDGTTLGGQSEIEVGETDLDGVTIELQTPASVQGRIILPDGHKQPNMMLVLESRSPFTMGGPGPVKLESDGTFTAKNVMPGEYFFRVFVPGERGNMNQDLFVASVMQGSADVRDSGFRVTASGSDPLVVRMESGAPVVNVKVLDEKQEPQQEAGVVLFNSKDDRRKPRPNFCMTDAAGACKVQGLAPGEYLALAYYPMESIDWNDSDNWIDLTKKAVPIKIGKGETATLELKVIPLD